MALYPPDKRTIKDDLFLVVQLAWHLGYIIAIPAVAFGFSGAYLDRTWGTSPLFILLGFCIAVTISSIGLWKKLKRICSLTF